MARMYDQIDYVLKFDTQAARDGAGYSANTAQVLTNVTAHKLTGGTWPGFWVILSKPTPFDPGMLNTSICQFAFCRNKMNAGQRFLLWYAVSGDVLDNIRLSPVFSGMDVPWGAIAHVPTGTVPAKFFGMTTYRSTLPTNFSSWPVGFYGKQPGTSWPYLQPFSRANDYWPNSVAPLSANLQAMNDLAAADNCDMEYMITGTPGWAVANQSPGTGAINGYTNVWNSFLPPDDDEDFIFFFTRLLGRCPRITTVYGMNEPVSYFGHRTVETGVLHKVEMAQRYSNWLTRVVHENFSGIDVMSSTLEPNSFTQVLKGSGYYDMWDYGLDPEPDKVSWHGYATDANVVWDRARKQIPLIYTFGLENKPLVDEEGGWLLDDSIGDGPGGLSNAPLDHDKRAAHVSKWLMFHWALGAEIGIWYGCAALAWGTLTSNSGVDDPAGTSYKTTRLWMLNNTMRRPGVCFDGPWAETPAQTFWIDWDLNGGGTARYVWRQGGIAFNYATTYLFKTDVAGVKTAVVAGSVTLDAKGKPFWLTMT